MSTDRTPRESGRPIFAGPALASAIISILCAITMAAAAGCAKKKKSPDKSDKNAPSAVPANPTPKPKPAAAPGAFNGLPVSATSPEAIAMIAESSEHWDLESTTHAHNLAVRATERDPGSILAWLHRANASLSTDEAIAATGKAKALQSKANPVERALLSIRAARQDGDLDGALKAAKSLVGLASESLEAHLVLSRIYTLRGEDEQARTAALEAAKLDPGSLSAHALLGESYTFREPRDLKKAAHHFKKTVELRPKIAATYVSLGDVYRADLDLAAASTEYGNAITADPKYPVGPIKRGHVNSFLGNYEQARADYDAGIKLGNARFGLSLSNYRAFVSIHEGRPEAAIEELEALLTKARATKLEAGEQNELVTYILENRAVIALHLAEVAKGAVKKPAIARAAAAANELVTAPEALGTPDQDPNSKRSIDATAAYWRGRAEIAQNRLDKAMEHAEAYAKLVEPDTNPRKLERYHELRGLIALSQQKYADAVEHLQKSDLQTAVFAKYHLGLALAGAGRKDDAKKVFREVADWSFNSPDYALLRKLADARAKAG